MLALPASIPHVHQCAPVATGSSVNGIVAVGVHRSMPIRSFSPLSRDGILLALATSVFSLPSRCHPNRACFYKTGYIKSAMSTSASPHLGPRVPATPSSLIFFSTPSCSRPPFVLLSLLSRLPLLLSLLPPVSHSRSPDPRQWTVSATSRSLPLSLTLVMRPLRSSTIPVVP